MRSLQGRLLAVLLGIIVLCWVVSLGILTVYLQHSRSSIWDDKLQAFATRILRAIPAAKKNFRAVGPGLEVRDEAPDPDYDLAVQIWSHGSLRSAHGRGPAVSVDTPATPLQPDFSDGFATRIIDGKRWRVYAVSDSTGTVQVQAGILHEVIDDEVRDATMQGLLANSLLLALVGALLWHTVRRSLAPVAALADMMRQRTSLDLTPLPGQALPTELHPLVESFNRLLVQLGRAVEGERQFIGDAAHELRTPLSALQAQAELARRAGGVAEKDAALDKLLVVARRTTRLSEQLLDLARLNAGTHAPRQRPANLATLVEHVVQEFEIQAEQNGRVLSLDTVPCDIVCDIDEMGILLRNLLDNALRYTLPGGRVRIRCGMVDGAGQREVFVDVADDGPGVPPDEHAAIFRRFHRAPGNRARGSGIGLSLVDGIARLHRARIETGTGLDGRGFGVRVVFPAAPVPCDTPAHQKR